MKIPSTPQRRRWISQSRGSATLLKPQEAFLQLSVAVACVMSAAREQLVTRIPDATPGLKVLGRLYPNIAWIRLVGSEQ